MTTMSRTEGLIARYKSVEVTTTEPGRLLVMTLEAAMRFAREAEEAAQCGDRVRARQRVRSVHAIVEHLAASLDPRIAPELCKNLLAVYSYCMGELLAYSPTAEAPQLKHVQRALAPIVDAFRVAVEQVPR